jgi:cobalt transporter subunit CbtB
MKAASTTTSIAAAGQSVRWPGLLALALGLLVVFGAGFASPTTIHNATHDTRHAFGLPCH